MCILIHLHIFLRVTAFRLSFQYASNTISTPCTSPRNYLRTYAMTWLTYPSNWLRSTRTAGVYKSRLCQPSAIDTIVVVEGKILFSQEKPSAEKKCQYLTLQYINNLNLPPFWRIKQCLYNVKITWNLKTLILTSRLRFCLHYAPKYGALKSRIGHFGNGCHRLHRAI